MTTAASRAPILAERAEIEKGMAWSERTKLADSHQGNVLKVLLAIRAGKSREQIQPALDELLAMQRADGGWRQIAEWRDQPQTQSSVGDASKAKSHVATASSVPTVHEMASDAYAMGQTLYVLSLAGYSAEKSEIKRAIEFLVATQKADGSWPMVS